MSFIDDITARRDKLIGMAQQHDALLAGMASGACLRESPSYAAQPDYSLPDTVRSVLVLALPHSETEPELDYWGGEGGSPGNLRLIRIARTLAEQISAEAGLTASRFDYGGANGTFLKDAAALAGLGVIGKNNLLVTPTFGPRVRLCALALDVEWPPTHLDAFSPCSSCREYCRKHCPQKAFACGKYSQKSCQRQMRHDERNPIDGRSDYRIAYCRACELSCPVGKA